MHQFLKTQDDFSLISKATPLISNLNMLENIALIKEVHELISIDEAEEIANKALSKIGLSNIGLFRLNQCSSMDVFYVMLIRALMTKEMNVIIVTPFALIKNIRNIKKVIDNINILNSEKTIYLLDDIANETHYKGCSCHIVK